MGLFVCMFFRIVSLSSLFRALSGVPKLCSHPCRSALPRRSRSFTKGSSARIGGDEVDIQLHDVNDAGRDITASSTSR
jgi:hypothetical protein